MDIISARLEAQRRLQALMDAWPKAQASDDHTRVMREEEPIFDFLAEPSTRHDAIAELRVIAGIAETAAKYREELIERAVLDGTPDRAIATAAQRSHSVIVRRRKQLGVTRNYKSDSDDSSS